MRGRVARCAGIRPWLAAMLAVGGLATGMWPVPADARPLITGITSIDASDPLVFQQVERTGARLVRVAVSWESVSPRGEPSSWQPENPADPHYDWRRADFAVTSLVEAGFTPVLMVHRAPSWAQRCRPPDEVRGEALKGSMCNPDPAKVAEFARAAAQRYSGYFAGLPRVRYWQAFNEPNLSLYFYPQTKRGRLVSPALYRNVINAFYSAVKSTRHSNLVLAAGLGPISVPRLTTGPMRFARKLLCMTGRRDPRPARGNCRGRVHFDIFDIHPYTTGGPNHRGRVDDVQLGDLGKLRDLLRAADKAGRIHGRFRHTPLWITEFSWDSRPPDPGGVPMRILRRWTAEALHRAWRAGASRFLWLALRDNPPRPELPSHETIEAGLFFRGETVAEDRPKPHMDAFRFPFVAYSRPGGFHFWGRTPNSGPGRVLIQARHGAGWRNATVARADRHGIFKGVVEGRYGRRKRGWVRARYRGERSVPFSLKPVQDFYQPPFGKPVR